MATRSPQPLRVPSSLPRGRAKLPRAVVVVSQRTRLIEGMAEAVAERGYAATTVADVIARAGVSRTTFYENFRDKEDCYLAAYDCGSDLHYQAVAEAIKPAAGWLAKLRCSTRAYLAVMEEEPAYARAFLVEALAAGSKALEHRAAAQQRYVAMLKELHAAALSEGEQLPELPDEIFLAMVEGGDALVVNELRGPHPRPLTELEPYVHYVIFALMGLQEPADRAMAKVEPPRRRGSRPARKRSTGGARKRAS